MERPRGGGHGDRSDRRADAPCKFFNTPRGCRHGKDCPFKHGSGTRRPPPGNSNHSNDSTNQSSRGSFTANRLDALLQELACCLGPLPVANCQQWVMLAQRHCSMGDHNTAAVLNSLKQGDGRRFLTALASQAHTSPRQLLGVLVPVLKLLTSPGLEHPLHSIPVLSVLHASLSLGLLSDQLAALSRNAAADSPSFFKDQGATTGTIAQAAQCAPSDWLDVLHPLALYLNFIMLRFSNSFQEQPQLLQGAQQLLAAITEAAAQHLPPGGAVATGKKAPDWRRLLADLAQLDRQLHAQQGNSNVLDQLMKMQELHKKEQKHKQQTGTPAGPGELHPGGPRHDNDKINHLQISVHPTRDEVLCGTVPFLPHNRSGSLPHAAHDPDRAHRELHFRLLRHDLLAPISNAVQAFREFGGVAGLIRVQHQTPGFSVRIRLKAGRDWQDLYVFRNVAILGLISAASRGSGSGIAYRVEFDDVPQLASTTFSRRREWWCQTKQLQHGSLMCLWWDGDTSYPSSSLHVVLAN